MIIEGILISTDIQGQPYLAAMGPVFTAESSGFELRPFTGSRSLANLKQSRFGVFHITDDPLLFAQAVCRQWPYPPQLNPAKEVPGWTIPSACRWYEFEVLRWDESGPRASVNCRTIAIGEGVPFQGICRARTAIIEAAVLVSRWNWVPLPEVQAAVARARELTGKTGGANEQLAVDVLESFISAGMGQEAAGSIPIPECRH